MLWEEVLVLDPPRRGLATRRWAQGLVGGEAHGAQGCSSRGALNPCRPKEPQVGTYIVTLGLLGLEVDIFFIYYGGAMAHDGFAL